MESILRSAQYLRIMALRLWVVMYGCSSRCPFDLVVLYLDTYLSHWGLLPL